MLHGRMKSVMKYILRPTARIKIIFLYSVVSLFLFEIAKKTAKSVKLHNVIGFIL